MQPSQVRLQHKPDPSMNSKDSLPRGRGQKPGAGAEAEPACAGRYAFSPPHWCFHLLTAGFFPACLENMSLCHCSPLPLVSILGGFSIYMLPPNSEPSAPNMSTTLCEGHAHCDLPSNHSTSRTSAAGSLLCGSFLSLDSLAPDCTQQSSTAWDRHLPSTTSQPSRLLPLRPRPRAVTSPEPPHALALLVPWSDHLTQTKFSVKPDSTPGRHLSSELGWRKISGC